METAKKIRTSKTQFSIYNNYIEKYPILRTGKLNPLDSTDTIKGIWELLVKELNSTGDGPIKDINGWKKLFIEWKSATRKKARQGRMLTDHESRFIQLTGEVAVSGIDVSELGIQEEVSAVMEVTATDEGRAADDGMATRKVTDDEISKKTKSKDRSKKKGNELLNLYKESQEEQNAGLNNIAEALHSIAESINRLCDLLE